jgi:hypothetical protein
MKSSTDDAISRKTLEMKRESLLAQAAAIERQLAAQGAKIVDLEHACIAANNDAALEAEIDEWQSFHEPIVE